MKYLLDTNICILYLNTRHTTVYARLQQIRRTDVCLCSIVKAELLYGALKSNRSADNLLKLRVFFSQFESLPFDDVVLEQYANIRVQLEEKGTPIGPHDLMIAAIAKAWNLILVTHNTAEFDRVKGLHIENWR